MRKLVLTVILILIIQVTMSCTNSCPEPPPINQVVDEDPAYLELAQNVADFIIHHPRMPADKIPYWGFDAPNIPDTHHDIRKGWVREDHSQFIKDQLTELFSCRRTRAFLLHFLGLLNIE